jgi:hypothetical protein
LQESEPRALENCRLAAGTLLDWLADSLDLNAANDKEIVADYGLGRNCTLFDKTRKWAYRAIRQGWPEYEQWLKACYERANAYNLQFPACLDERGHDCC